MSLYNLTSIILYITYLITILSYSLSNIYLGITTPIFITSDYKFLKKE